MDESFGESGSGMLEENSTWSASCAASSLQAASGSGLPPNIDIAVRVFQVTFTLLQSTFGVVLNGLVVVLIVTSKKLRNVSFAIAIQIAIVDLFLTIGSNFLPVFNSMSGRWIMGLPFCIVIAFLSFVLYYSRAALILVFSLDRFALVFVPFDYPRYSKRVVLILCVLFLCFSFINSFVLLPPFLDCYQFHLTSLSCAYSPYCNSNCKIFNHILLMHAVPLTLLPAVFFTALFIKGRKIRQQDTSMTGENTGMTDKDWRAIKTFILILLPSFLPAIVNFSPLYRNSSLPFVAKNLMGKMVSSIASLIVIVDPFIILSNADIKEALKMMIKKIKDYRKV